MPGLAALCVLLTLLGATCQAAGGAVLPSAAARGTAAGACAGVYFLGARGSGEAATAASAGIGPEVYWMSKVVARVLAAQGVASFATVADPYPADSVTDLLPSAAEVKQLNKSPLAAVKAYNKDNLGKYLASIDTGIADAVSQAKHLYSTCPHALLILAGYSQGAMVMHQAELRLVAAKDAGLRAHIAGTLLLGDGDRVPFTRAREFGASNKQFGAQKASGEGIRTWVYSTLGLGRGHDVAMPATTANICDAGDLVCDSSLSRLVRHAAAAADVHTSYVVHRQSLTNAATWIGQLTARRLAGRTVLLPTLPVSQGCAATIAMSSSSNGRYILLAGCAVPLIRLDRYTGTKLTVAAASYPYDGDSQPRLTDDGNTAAYGTVIGNRSQVVVRNLVSGKAVIASSASGGSPANQSVIEYTLSPNGQWLLFSSDASNLVPGVKSDATGNDPNLFLKNLKTGSVSLAVKTKGLPDGDMTPDGVSDSGALIAFGAAADNITGIAPATGLRMSAYLRDVRTGTVRRLLYGIAGVQTQGSANAAISGDATRAAFLGLDTDGFETTVLSCSVPAGLAKPPACKRVASAFPVFDLHLASNGSALEYSAANTPVSSTTWEVFRVGFGGGNSSTASVNDVSDPANADTGNIGGIQGISGDGSTVFFSSSATNLDPGAVDGQVHAFVRT